jgi:hypothetical protein
MNALSGRVPGVGYRALAAALAALAVMAVPAGAAPMKARLHAARAAAVDYWESYYRRALTNQSRQVVVPSFLRSLSLQPNGMLPDSAFVDYLRWRRGLAPQRFDANHPRISRLLIQDQLARQTVKPPPVVPVVVPPRTTNPRPQPLEPPRVPEPSSLVIAASLLGAAAWWRRREKERLRSCELPRITGSPPPGSNDSPSARFSDLPIYPRLRPG